MISLDYVTPTPWDTPREVDEREMMRKIDWLNKAIEYFQEKYVRRMTMARLRFNRNINKAFNDLKLKGFEKVSLAPGETSQVTMEVEATDLAYYDVQTESWEVEETAYDVYVGASSRDLLLSDTFVPQCCKQPFGNRSTCLTECVLSISSGFTYRLLTFLACLDGGQERIINLPRPGYVGELNRYNCYATFYPV